MFCVIYSFKVFDGQQEKFINSWNALTSLIYEHEGSLGSRLHRKSDHVFIAYAQWPNKKTWQESGSNLPATAKEISKVMKESCSIIETTHKLEVVDDLLKNELYK